MQKADTKQVLLEYVSNILKNDDSFSISDWMIILNSFIQNKSTKECAKLLQIEEQMIIKIYYQFTMELSRYALDTISK